jgi:hypothetical protein
MLPQWLQWRETPERGYDRRGGSTTQRTYSEHYVVVKIAMTEIGRYRWPQILENVRSQERPWSRFPVPERAENCAVAV